MNTRKPLTTGEELLLAVRRGWNNIFRYWRRSLWMGIMVLFCVAIAIALIALAEGGYDKGKTGPPDVTQTLDELRTVVREGAILLTAMLLLPLTWNSIDVRRYYVGIQRIRGKNPIHVIIEFLVEACIVCVLGGFVGLDVGVWIFPPLLHWRFPHLQPLFLPSEIVLEAVIVVVVSILSIMLMMLLAFKSAKSNRQQ